MENGDAEPEQRQHQHAGKDLLCNRTDAEGHFRNGKRHKGTNDANDTKPNQKGWQLLGCPIFIVPVSTDLSAQIFRSPPRQQVPELQVTTYLFRSIKCNNQMENGLAAHVVSHVA